MIGYKSGFSRKCQCGKRGITYNGQGEIVCFDHTPIKQREQMLDFEKKMKESNIIGMMGEKANG